MTAFRSRQKLAASGTLAAALALSACGGEQSPPVDPASSDLALPDTQLAENGVESVDLGVNPFDDAEQVAAAVDGVAFEVNPAEPVSLASGGMITVHWAGTSGASPVAVDDCQAMVTITTPAAELLAFKPEITGCSGSEGIWISEAVGATAGDYTMTVILDGIEAAQTVTVTA